MSRWWLVSMVVFAACTPMPVRYDEEGDAEAVRAVVEGYVAARDDRDVDTVAGALAGDVDQLTSRGEWRRGREASLAGMKRSSSQNPGERTLTIETVRFVSAGVALVDARYVIAAAEDSPERRLWSCFVVVHDVGEGAWRIAAIRNMKPAE